jgi:RluA family pseudouridine synthase
LRSVLEPEYGHLWIVHRLDKETSGATVLARTASAHRYLNGQFAQNQVEKTYLAIIAGVPPWGEKTVDAPLRVGVGRRKRSVIDPERGKPAVTVFHILAKYRTNALVEARPQTGRTHQIRTHLYSLGFPVLADPLYGKGALSNHIQRLALHAYRLALQHPTSGTKVTFTAPLPQDLESAIRQLSL